MLQQFGVCSGLNKVDQLLWRMTRCGFGRRNSFFFEFSSLNSFSMTAESQLLVYFEFWPCFSCSRNRRVNLRKSLKDSSLVLVCVVKGVHPR